MYTKEQQQDDKLTRVAGATGALAGLALTIAALAIIYSERVALVPQGDDVMAWFGLCISVCCIALGIHVFRLPDREPPGDFPGWD